ncbi:hypothetical protein FA95DRAFT_1684484 [Auriscalpium vulgare]|uniref:Uncharacterized protein n=1 Tax=Auriscalpium vulgare TaxID=40419 RepID=A0ACB8R425_9AGAM|nr:hypothetical protein FA95DRAFT_1684484 [Auriscalpium vulgare]
MSTTTELSRQLRILLENPQAVAATDVYALVDEFVLECSASSEPEVLLFHLDEQLQAIHDSCDLSEIAQTEVLLAVLRRLEPVISSTSLISTWFELILRPALREPKLSRRAVDDAVDLVIIALEKEDAAYPEKQGDFRRRILDLYLLDAFNEGSGDDVLEWAELTPEQREKRNVWKANLEDILVRFGNDQPEDLLTQVYDCFASSSSRLQLLGLLNRYTSQPSFERHACVLAAHPIMSSLMTSLLVDNSTTVCMIGLTMITKLLPILAVKECGALRRMLPQLFAILARIICWRERDVADVQDAASSDEASEASEASESADEGARALKTHPDLKWERLELTFKTAAPAPSPRQYFTFLYYLFPCNMVAFLREPAEYLTECNAENPYAVKWDEVLDREQIKTKSEILLRQHVTHPQVIWRNAQTELSETQFFATYDVPRIVAEVLLLEIRNSPVATPEQSVATAPVHPPSVSDEQDTSVPDDSDSRSSTPPLKATVLSGKPRISLQDMVNTSIALKSNLDIEIVDPTVWPYALFPQDAGTRTQSPERGDAVPSHVAQAISGLQREVLRLRTELNFSTWLARENVRQIGRMYEHRIQSRNAEVERQGLHNKLREYKAQVAKLNHQLKTQMEQAAKLKQQYSDWLSELHGKMNTMRTQKQSWTAETAALRLAEKESKAQLEAQGKLLAEADQEVFRLKTSIKESAAKVERLRDYEKRIEQLTALQKLWDADVAKFKVQREVLTAMHSKYKKMELLLQTYEGTHAKMEEQARTHRRQQQTLEGRLAAALLNKQRPRPPAQNDKIAEEVTRTKTENMRLRDENTDLRYEVEEVRAMVEVLRAQVSGHRGVLADPTQSPRSGPLRI